MKSSVLIVCLFSICHLFAQEESSKSNDVHFGVAINSGAIKGPESMYIAPTALLQFSKHQVEAGFTIHPLMIEGYNRMLGAEVSHKYFPFGLDKRFSMYLMSNFTYTWNHVEFRGFNDQAGSESGYENNQNYISLMGGLGVQVKIFGNAYIGTNLNVGANTSSATLKLGPGPEFSYRSMFDDYGLDGAIRLNIGYRF
ncbi:MAG: hypothetical protein AB8B56_03790 [Crocinitomicaceae bacterium]